MEKLWVGSAMVGWVAVGGSQRMLAHHVVSDVETEGSSLIVHEGSRVEGEGGQTDVEHTAGIGQQ